MSGVIPIHSGEMSRQVEKLVRLHPSPFTIMKFKYKILLHITAIGLLLLGMVFVHIAHNYDYLMFPTVRFFGYSMTLKSVFDTGLLLISIAFFIEFILTFKPIKIQED